MKVTFLYHSSYFVEMDTCCLLFDYYQGDIPQVDKPLYVFASHSHGDHFSPVIFQLAQGGKEVHYLLSDDISPLRPMPSAKWGRSRWPRCVPPTWGWLSSSNARESAFTMRGT